MSRTRPDWWRSPRRSTGSAPLTLRDTRSKSAPRLHRSMCRLRTSLPGPPRMQSADRPLSPHLQIYRWQLTSVLSILHRAAGIVLSAGTLLLVWWLVAAATGPRSYAGVQHFLGSWLG